MRKTSFLIIVSVFFSISVFAQPNEGFTEKQRVAQYNIGRDGLAIDGYDPVCYFTQNKAVKGKLAIYYKYKGVLYNFANQENREKFVASPEKWEPQYGGWCAYALGDSGEKVKINPETFKIVNGKLYLFYDFLFNNTKTKWDKDEQNLLRQANVNWDKIIEN
ncbi:YHS domain-containing (seleno)protein [Mariniphaga anaerophila]|nr:YHS domain-containing (seleno)protein [Mariniphaga anaerophila]